MTETEVTKKIDYQYGKYENKAEALGLALTLFCQSRQYHQAQFGPIVSSITSSVECGHYMFQLVDRVPVGVICWAMVNESVKNDIARRLRQIHGSDFVSGDICFLTQISAVYGDGSSLVTEAYNTIKPRECWGINVQRKTRNPEFPVYIFKIDATFDYKAYLRS